MKTKTWAALLAAVLALSLGLGLWLMAPGQASGLARITSKGELVRVVSLAADQEFRVETGDGFNVVTVKDGKIAVTNASCPDHYCMHRGFCDSGMDIVCLPNGLVISFLGEQEVDGAVG